MGMSRSLVVHLLLVWSAHVGRRLPADESQSESESKADTTNESDSDPEFELQPV